jgi:hypothetical protein
VTAGGEGDMAGARGLVPIFKDPCAAVHCLAEGAINPQPVLEQAEVRVMERAGPGHPANAYSLDFEVRHPRL